MSVTKPAEPNLRRYRGSSGDERRGERREKILEAAIREYGAHGYRNVGVRSVCAAAGLTERYFYEAFPNSEALLIACLEVLTEQLVSTVSIAGVAETGGIMARRRTMLRTYYQDLQLKAAAARVFLIEINGVSPAVDAAFAHSTDRFGELILDAFDPDRRGPAARDGMMRHGITGGLLHIALAWIAEGYARPVDAVVESALQFCLLAEPADGTVG